MANIISIGGGSGRPKYTATISANATDSYIEVQVNGTGAYYRNNGDTFTWTDGDNLVFRLGDHEWTSSVYENGTRIKASYGGYYTYTPPSKDISINFILSTGDYLTVEITYPDNMNITENGVYNISDYESVSVSVGGVPDPVSIDDPVRFFDYDGTLLYSYTASDFQSLSAMPANPSHSGLTAQGWNWSLTDAKAQVTAMGTCDIGQMYVTSDGKTRVYCRFEEGRLSPYLGIGVNGTVTINWGDNTATSTLTGSNTSTVQRVQHTYASEGDYIISLTANGSFAFYGNSNGSYFLQTAETPAQYNSLVYLSCIKKIELGTGVILSNNAFYNCYSLKHITVPNYISFTNSSLFYYCYSLTYIVFPSGLTSIGNTLFNSCRSLVGASIPNTVTSIGSNLFSNSTVKRITLPRNISTIGSTAFGSCYNLRHLILPSSLTSIGSSIFSSCSSLASVIIPSSVTSIGSNSFNACSSLANITIPSSVTSIGTSAFSACRGLGEIHFKSTTPPTIENTNAFNSLQSTCKIYVPRGYLSAYTSASNYPSSATYTYVEE